MLKGNCKYCTDFSMQLRVPPLQKYTLDSARIHTEFIAGKTHNPCHSPMKYYRIHYIAHKVVKLATLLLTEFE